MVETTRSAEVARIAAVLHEAEGHRYHKNPPSHYPDHIDRERAAALYDAGLRATSRDSEDTVFAWLVERGQSEGFTPPVYYGSYAAGPQVWTSDAFKAVRYASGAEADEWIAKHVTPRGIGARAVEHGFTSRDSEVRLRDALTTCIKRFEAIEHGLDHGGDLYTECAIGVVAARDALTNGGTA